jgi:uncharacterized oligopeptide transporter (OPT) family protein
VTTGVTTSAFPMGVSASTTFFGRLQVSVEGPMVHLGPLGRVLVVFALLVVTCECGVLCAHDAAAFGCALPPLTFAIGKLLGLRDATAFLGGCCVIFDLMNTIESRLILVDSQLMFYCGLALWTALKYWKRRNEVRGMRVSSLTLSALPIWVGRHVSVDFPGRLTGPWASRSGFCG